PGSVGEAAAPDSISLLSLQTIASDLQKFDSVEHLLSLCDASSLDCQPLGPEHGHREARGGCRHHRSVSL
ncbi:3BP5L protein, partial [Psilopogon haemacephalus]|nr:3BP5L protein [Psilopogon haemacephalus]